MSCTKLQRYFLGCVLSAIPLAAQTGVYTLNGGSATEANQSYTATAADQSAIYVLNSGTLTLTSPTVAKSGDASSVNNSSQYGINAGILAASASTVTISGGTISTSASGANGLFATGSGSSITMSNGTIATTGGGSHGVDVTYGGSITLNNVNITTAQGQACAALSTDFGGGTVTVNGGTMKTAGSGAPGIYSTGTITVTGATIDSTVEGGGVIDGANTISLTNTSLTGVGFGIKLHQTAPATGTATVAINGGWLTATSGDAIYLAPENGTLHAAITIKGAASIATSSGNLVNATVASIVTLTLDGETVKGNLVADSASSIAATLQNGTALTGSINRAALTLDSSSNWTVTANSTLTGFADKSGVSGSTITNVTGNGYTVYYDATLAANSYLNGATYTLAQGGYLAPAGSTVTNAPSITAGGIANGASNVAGIAPGAWASIYGANLATGSVAVTSSNLVNGYLPTTLSGASVAVDGIQAYLDYVSPGQINIQVPADSNTGTATVVVTTASGTASATVAISPIMPGVFTSSNWVLTVRPTDSVIINGTGAAVPGYTTAASARPGDVLAIYATGLGPTTAPVSPGFVFSGTYYTSSVTPTVAIGGVNAPVAFSGLVGAGLFQLNITVPATLPNGTYPVVITQSGASSPSTAMLKVAAN